MRLITYNPISREYCHNGANVSTFSHSFAGVLVGIQVLIDEDVRLDNLDQISTLKAIEQESNNSDHNE